MEKAKTALEASRIDGANPMQVSFLVVLPLIKPGLAAAAIFPFRIASNEFILALTGILFPMVAGSDLRILTTIGGLVSMKLCWLTGYVTSLTDMRTGCIVSVVACISALTIFQLHYSSLCQRELKLSPRT